MAKGLVSLEHLKNQLIIKSACFELISLGLFFVAIQSVNLFYILTAQYAFESLIRVDIIKNSFQRSIATRKNLIIGGILWIFGLIVAIFSNYSRHNIAFGYQNHVFSGTFVAFWAVFFNKAYDAHRYDYLASQSHGLKSESIQIYSRMQIHVAVIQLCIVGALLVFSFNLSAFVFYGRLDVFVLCAFFGCLYNSHQLGTLKLELSFLIFNLDKQFSLEFIPGMITYSISVFTGLSKPVGYFNILGYIILSLGTNLINSALNEVAQTEERLTMTQEDDVHLSSRAGMVYNSFQIANF